MARRGHNKPELSIEHKGHTIEFYEDGDKWRCDDLNIENASLAAVKRKIDEHGKSERKVNLEAYMIESDYFSRRKETLQKVRVTIICEPYREGEAARECWITKEDKSRSKVNISDIIPIENEKQALEWVDARKAVKDAEAAAEKAKKAIGCYTEKTMLAAAKAAKP